MLELNTEKMLKKFTKNLPELMGEFQLQLIEFKRKI